MLTKVALGSAALFYLYLAYMNVFAQKAFLGQLHLSSTYILEPSNPLTGLATISMRCFGVACFIFSFIMGHMIPIKDKHPAALRTSATITGAFCALYAHRAFLDTATTPAGSAAAGKQCWINLFLFALQFIAMMNSEPKEKKDEDVKKK